MNRIKKAIRKNKENNIEPCKCGSNRWKTTFKKEKMFICRKCEEIRQ